ncbi:MAG: hypothetical protein ABIY37_09640 [Devosia sp.]
MAGHRATNSVYATIGVAAATLLVVGGILAGPSILECSRDADGFGACLREKVADSGLIAPDVSSEPSPPAGWMEAVANEYEAPASTPVGLEGSRAELVAEDVTVASSEPVEVAIAPAMELATVTVAPSGELANVELVGPQGAISADVATADTGSDGTAQLSQPNDGELTAAAPSPPAFEVAITPEPIDPADDLTSAVEPPPSEPAPVELSAEPTPVEPEPPEPSSVSPVPSESPSSSEPGLVIEFNPQYPNVLVLPPPASGDNSSFRSLQLN